MSTIRFVMLGGFLGAGKTTTLGRLARAYRARGRRVGIVTNDQAADLVDSHTLRGQGFPVGEVAGSCFCCNFDALTGAMAGLAESDRPDVILAEPVGSCTDLAATVIQPLRQLYDAQFSVAPYGVILKPSHGRKILRNEPGSGFSPKAAYIFRKQLEEADFVVLNRIDELAQEQVEELAELVRREYDVPLLRISARSGEGFDGLLAMLDQQGAFGRRILEIDYDTYAEGEAELGWLNGSVRVRAAQPFSLDRLLLEIIERLKGRLAAAGAEPAHLKAIGLWEGYQGVANLIASDSPAELSLASGCQTREADLIVNARVAIDPEELTRLVHFAVSAACESQAAQAEFQKTQSFRPGRPVPTHRYATAAD